MSTGLFSRVSLVGMDGQPLASAPAGDDAAKESLLEVLHHTRQTPPDQEVILERLDQFAEIAAGLGKEEMRRRWRS